MEQNREFIVFTISKVTRVEKKVNAFRRNEVQLSTITSFISLLFSDSILIFSCDL